MRIEMAENGYEKIEAQIQAIEDLAYGGVFANGGAPGKCQRITLEVKKLRQIVKAAMILVPDTVRVPRAGSLRKPRRIAAGITTKTFLRRKTHGKD